MNICGRFFSKHSTKIENDKPKQCCHIALLYAWCRLNIHCFQFSFFICGLSTQQGQISHKSSCSIYIKWPFIQSDKLAFVIGLSEYFRFIFCMFLFRVLACSHLRIFVNELKRIIIQLILWMLTLNYDGNAIFVIYYLFVLSEKKRNKTCWTN